MSPEHRRETGRLHVVLSPALYGAKVLRHF